MASALLPQLCVLCSFSLVCLVTLCGSQQTTPVPRRRVNVPPLITGEPDYQIAFRPGEAIAMPCTAVGTPDPFYTWYRDGAKFDPSGLDGRVATRPGEGTLIFENPKEEDEAIYQCNATNQVGTALSKKINLRVAYLAPFLAKPVVHVQRTLGHPAVLRCVPPRSYPIPEVFWARFVPGRAIQPVQLTNRLSIGPEGNLHIAHIEASDATRGDEKYVCIAQNTKMRSSVQGDSVTVSTVGQYEQTMGPTIMYADVVQQVALRGVRFEVACIFSGNPTPRITWTRFGADFTNRFKAEQFNTKMVLEPADFDDAGRYECAGINDATQVPIRRSFDLKVESMPFWTHKPVSVNAAENETAVFLCDGEGIPKPQIFWFINGVPIAKVPGNPRRIVEEKKVTYIRLQKSDVAVIQCNVTNKHGYIFTNAYLNVQTEPATIIQRPIEGQLAAEGKTINLTCEVTGSPRPLIVWRKSTEQLTGGRYVVTPEGHLTIKDVQLTDSGLYTCFATNIYGNDTAKGTLIVRRRTQILTAPLDLMVFEKTEAKFTCTGTTDPEEIRSLEIVWEKDGQVIDYQQAQRVYKNFMDNSLTISGTITLDTGKYTCTARSALDSDSKSAQLIVQAPPDPPTNVIVRCTQPNNNNKTEIEWQPGRENYAPILNYVVQFNTSFQPDTWIDITSNLTSNTRKLEIQLSPYGNFTFRVLARNKIGMSYPSAPTKAVCTTQPALPVKNPENVIAEGDEPNNLVIFWTPMPQIDHYGSDFVYILEWKRMDDDNAERGTTTIAEWDVWFHLIPLDNVPPYTKYEVKVKCRNGVGLSRAADSTTIGHSGEDVPKERVVDLRINETAIGSSTAVLMWTHVDTSPEQIQGFFRGYRVQYARDDEWPENVEEEDFIIDEPEFYPRPRPRLKERVRRDIIENGTNDQNMVVVRLHHLPPDSLVRVQVRVLSKYYAGPPSDAILFRTAEGPPGPPALFDIIGRGSTHLDLSWSPPLEQNGELVGYNISFQAIHGLNLAETQYFNPISNASVNYARLTGLAPGTAYRVYLAAATSKGSGRQIFLDTRSLPPGPPSPPTFQITAINETYIRVVWEPSRLGSNPGSVFYVQYRIRTMYPWRSSPDEFQEKYMEILNLLPGTVYQVRVVAKNGDGHQAPAEYQEVRTDGVAPGSYHLARAAWFYGIFLSFIFIVILVVVFAVIKLKITDPHWAETERKIEAEVETLQAQHAVAQMGFFNPEREGLMPQAQPYYPEGHYAEAEPFDPTKEPNFNPGIELYDQPRPVDIGYRPQHEIITDKETSMV